MAAFCIVCEYNPLHNGHVYLIERARELGADTVTCIMSGNATQRGELAITDKYLRAEAAVKCGADLVIELPYPWCASSADYFATAALSLAFAFGEKLVFGSESADTAALIRAAELCETEEFRQSFDERISSGEGAAGAYLSGLAEKGFEGISSNDILGIAYIRAIKRMGLDITPVAVKRQGAAFNCEDTVEGTFQSATALRSLIFDGSFDALERFMPLPMLEILKAEKDNASLTDMREIDTAVLSFFRLSSPEDFRDIAEAGGGLANRICSIAHESKSYLELFQNVRTKRYTDAKIRRAMLFCMTGVKHRDIYELPAYTTLLASNDKGRELLSKNKKLQDVRVVTKPADAPREEIQYMLSERLDALYTLARSNRQNTDCFIKKKAYIQK